MSLYLLAEATTTWPTALCVCAVCAFGAVALWAYGRTADNEEREHTERLKLIRGLADGHDADPGASVDRGFALARAHFAAMAESAGQPDLAARIRKAELRRKGGAQ